MKLELFDYIALFLGVMFTLRKLDTQSRNPAQQPGVDAEAFKDWQRRAASAYSPGAYASFCRVLFHIFYFRYATHHPLSPLTYGRIGLTVDGIWLASVISSFVRAHYASELRRKLGIALDKPQVIP